MNVALSTLACAHGQTAHVITHHVIGISNCSCFQAADGLQMVESAIEPLTMLGALQWYVNMLH